MASACSSSEPEAKSTTPVADAGATGPASDAVAPNDGATTPPSVEGCKRTAKTHDVRAVVVSLPYDANGAKAKTYELLHLAADGTLKRDGKKFEMANDFDAPIVFSPDGELGVAVQDNDGTLGIFRIDESGAPVVVDPGFGKDSFYADSVAFSADGSRVFVVDSNRNKAQSGNTGGVHEIAIACDGKPTYVGRVLEAPGAGGIAFLPGTSLAAVPAGSVAGGTSGHDLFVLDLAGTAKVSESIALFGDDLLSVWGVALTPDGKLGLVADGNEYMGTHRVGVFSLEGGLKKVSVLDVDSPSGIVVSPWGNAAIVTQAGGSSIDGLNVLSIDGTTVTAKGKLTNLVGGKPQLPTAPVVVKDGALKGLVLVAEVPGVRRVRFDATGAVTDLGVTDFGGGLDSSVGSVGLQQ